MGLRPAKRMKARMNDVVESTTWIAPLTECFRSESPKPLRTRGLGTRTDAPIPMKKSRKTSLLAMVLWLSHYRKTLMYIARANRCFS